MSSSHLPDKGVPAPVDIFLRQAEAYMKTEAWEKAIASCKRALELDESTAEAYKLMGDVFRGMGQIADALGCYAEALLVRPEYPEVYVNLGSLYGSLGDWEQAATYYQTATELDPGFVEAYRQLAKVWENLNQPNDYVDTIYQSLSLSPETFTADEHCEMGQLLLAQGQEHEALVCFERAVELDANHVEAQKQLQPLIEKQTKGELTAPAFERHYPSLLLEGAEPSESERGDAIEALVVLARSYIQHGNVDKAIPYYEHAFRLDSQNQHLYQEIVEVLGQAGQDEKIAEIQYQVLSSKVKGVPAETYGDLGDRLLQQGKSSQAIECYRQAIQIKPDSIELAQKLIQGLKAEGRLKETAQAYLALAQLLQRKKNTREAIELLKKALEWLNIELTP